MTTVRLGGFDVLVNSLAAQTFSKEDWELIIVDEWAEDRIPVVYGRVVSSGIKNSRIIPPRVTHAYIDDATGYNTGLQVAHGELIIFLTDMIWCYPEFLADHWYIYQSNPGKSLTGFLDRYAPPAIKMPVDPAAMYWTVFEEEFTAARAEEYFAVTPVLYAERKGLSFDHNGGLQTLPPDKFYAALNESIPMAVLKEINGWDERFNGGYGVNDIDLGMRAALIGWEFLVDFKSINRKLGDQSVLGKIPRKQKARLRTPDDNYKLYLDHIQRIVEGKETVAVPPGHGCWA